MATSLNLNPKMKSFVIGLIGLFLILMILQNVNANFVCGQVLDSEDNVSANWYNVRLFYPNKPDNFTSCEVSPADNKYCCDSESIPGSKWKIGDYLTGEVYGDESGYITLHQSITTSGNGYDVLSVMQLLKVIKINNPRGKLILTNSDKINLALSTIDPYNKISINKNGSIEEICDNCNSINQSINLNFGSNNLDLIASNGIRNISEKLDFNLIKSYNIVKSITCEKCNNNKVRSSQRFNVKINLILSNDVSSLLLKEFVPRDFEIINNNGGEVYQFSDSHNVIIWNVSGKNINKEYTLVAPEVLFFNRKYLFRTNLDVLNISLDKVVVRKILPFLDFDQKGNFSSVKKIVYSRIYSERPLVLRPKRGEIERIIVFPKSVIENVEFNLINFVPKNSLDDVINYYRMDTNLPNSKIDEVDIDFKVDKDLIKNKGYSDIAIYYLNNDSWEESKVLIVSEDDNDIYYNTNLPPNDGIAIVGEKVDSGFLSNLYNSIF